MRLDAELDLAADALGDRCVAGRARQQLGRARPQPDGPSFPCRRRRARSRASTTSTTTGAGPSGFYIPRYRNLDGDKRGYLRGFGYQGGACRSGLAARGRELGVGGGFKDRMAEPGAWAIGATAFGEMLPDHDNRVTLDETQD